MTDKRAMPIKTAKVELAGDYEGWTATVHVNPPMFLFEQLLGGALAETRDALSKIVKSWDFVDSQGDALPQPSEGGVGHIGFDLMLLLVRAISEKVTTPEKNS